MPSEEILSARSSGILLPLAALAKMGGPLGAGGMRFLEFLSAARQSWWQILPLCPTDDYGSPYNSTSSFAADERFVSASLLRRDGWLDSEEPTRDLSALAAAFLRFETVATPAEREEFANFRRSESAWLDDHALFAALRRAQKNLPWIQWDEALRRRRPDALAAARARYLRDIDAASFGQWVFARQWAQLRRDARSRGIRLIGDVPIYVSHDSVDCWAHQELFQLTSSGAPAAVAGVPPDYFSATGQLWGNPLYHWEEHARSGFRWWIERLRVAGRRFDAARLDHFIGFTRYWSVPPEEKTAGRGRWESGPGAALFQEIFRSGAAPRLIAEDLGLMTPEVAALRDKFHLPGMRVGQFSFGAGSEEWPMNWPEYCVGFTATHDNDTTRGWLDHSSKERDNFLNAIGSAAAAADPALEMLRLVWKSPCQIAIAPMQDILGLGSAARTNRPGTTDGNWSWTLGGSELSAAAARSLAELTVDAKRSAP